MSVPNDSFSPGAELSRDHRIIERVLGVLRTIVAAVERGAVLERDSAGRCVEFFRLFADACHHGKEEDLLFPVLEARGIPRDGGPIGMMLQEHKIGRELTRQMGAALSALDGGEAGAMTRFRDAANQYVAMLTQHIWKEDNVLFRMGEMSILPDDRVSLCRGFGEVGCRAFEGRRREELERIADELEARHGASH